MNGDGGRDDLDGINEMARYTIMGLTFAAIILAVGTVWVAGFILGIIVLAVLAVVAGAVGQYAGSGPTAITSRSFVELYLRTLLKELPVTLRQMFTPAIKLLVAWFLISLAGWMWLQTSRLERTGLPDFSGLGPWMSDTASLAVVLFVVIALFYMRQFIWSVITMLLGLDGRTETTIALGAREPTRSEHNAIILSMQEIQDKTGGNIQAPEAWMVVDGPMPNHYVIGKTVYLTSALIESRHRMAGMLHALGHIQHGDGAILLSLRRLIAPFPYYYGIDRRAMPPGIISGGHSIGGTQSVARADDIELSDRMQAVEYAEKFAKEYGGIGLMMYGLHWASFWRERVYLADAFVQRCGYSEELIEYLEEFQVFDVAQPFLARGRPYTAERIDRLEG